jgi:hypothetical protein
MRLTRRVQASALSLPCRCFAGAASHATGQSSSTSNAAAPIVAATVIHTGGLRRTGQLARPVEPIARATVRSQFIIAVIELGVRDVAQLPVPKATVTVPVFRVGHQTARLGVDPRKADQMVRGTVKLRNGTLNLCHRNVRLLNDSA